MMVRMVCSAAVANRTRPDLPAYIHEGDRDIPVAFGHIPLSRYLFPRRGLPRGFLAADGA